MTERHGRKLYLEIFLASFAGLLLEISYTRIISFKLFYYYTYLIIGFGLLGMGAGGVLLAIAPRLAEQPPARVVARASLAGALLSAAGYVLIARIPLSTSALWSSAVEPAKLVIVSAALFLPFLAIGVVIAVLLSSLASDIGRLYFADLAGAGLACALAVPLLTLLTPPGCVWLAGALLAGVAARAAGDGAAGHASPRAGTAAVDATARTVARRQRPGGTDAATTAIVPGAGTVRLVRVAAVVGAVLLAGALWPAALPQPVTDAIKTVATGREGEQDPLFSRWSPVFRVDVTADPRGGDDVRMIHHDGLLGSTLHRWDGDVASLARFDTDERAFPFSVGPEPPANVLIIGAAGGHEVLAALRLGAAHVTAVELNPVTVSLLTDVFADYSGHLADDPRVDLVNDEGRSYLAKHDTKYDLIYYVAPDSYAAANAATAGAFVLSESYLYTAEMIEQSLAHLTDDGLICMQFGEFAYDRKPNRTARYVATARKAFEHAGISDFQRHVLVVTRPTWLEVSTVLLKASALTDADVERFMARSLIVEGSVVRYAPGRDFDRGPVGDVIALPDDQLDAWYRGYPYDVAPITDDSPFFWHFARFRSVLAAATGRAPRGDTEDSIGERLLLGTLVIAVAFAAVFLLLPFVTVRKQWAELPRKLRTGVYFAAIGMGFMFFEIALIQKLTLLLGYPTYSLSVTMMSLLVFAGLGSYSSSRYEAHRDRALVILVVSILTLVAFYLTGLDAVVAHFVGSPAPIRMAAAVAVTAPLALCLGGFLPLGMATVAVLSPHPREQIAWSWAVNGFFSVISSVATTVFAMTLGFKAVFVLGAAAYVIAAAALRTLPYRAR